MKFSTRLKELRIEKDMTQADLAKEIGYSQRAVSKWELGKTEPTASALIKLSEFFGETVQYLLGIED
ncbi:MAG: helix-turn-helix transcriptional regulator [Clostridiales bacterium]|nr:helix-turn-helix transcriptional regulator [Clostridiales bacterium]